MTDQSPELNEPSRFKQEWEAKKLLKQTKKKAKKAMMARGHGRKDASKMVNKAIKNIVTSNRPERKAAGRGG